MKTVTQLPRAKKPALKPINPTKKAKTMATDANDTVTKEMFPLPAPDKTTVVKASMAWPDLPIPETVDQDLVTILAWPRCHDTASELAFLAWLRSKLESLGYKPEQHQERAVSVSVPLKDGRKSSSLFSSHIDTVDGVVYNPTLRKKIAYDRTFGHIFLEKDNTVGTCLGADDGVGVWIMLKMIEAKVPGTYLFNRGEERGGVSAKAIAAKEADWLNQFQIAVAFDRPRDNEVITHQRGGTECASDKFANALAQALNNANDAFTYKPSKSGVYTDTFEFRRNIPECVNLGVGYENQHGASERLDYAHATALLEACCKIDWEALPVDRDPAKPDPMYQRDDYWSGWNMPKKAKAPTPAPAPAKQATLPELHIEDEIAELGGLVDVTAYLECDPENGAELLLEAAAELAALRKQVDFYRRITFKR